MFALFRFCAVALAVQKHSSHTRFRKAPKLYYEFRLGRQVRKVTSSMIGKLGLACCLGRFHLGVGEDGEELDPRRQWGPDMRLVLDELVPCVISHIDFTNDFLFVVFGWCTSRHMGWHESGPYNDKPQHFKKWTFEEYESDSSLFSRSFSHCILFSGLKVVASCSTCAISTRRARK